MGDRVGTSAQPVDQGQAPVFRPAAVAISPLGRTSRRAWSRVLGMSRVHRYMAVLLVLFLVKGFLISLIFPPFSGHDEVAHYGYLDILATEHRPPIIPDLDQWQADYADSGELPSFDQLPPGLYEYAGRFTTADWFGDQSSPLYAIKIDLNTNGTIEPDEYYPSGWIYTGNHPPLYYLLMLPVWYLVHHLPLDQQIYFFRFAAIPFGMITVLMAYLTVRAIFPRDTFLHMLVPAFVAFQPQISYEAAMLNNDILAIMFSSVLIWQLSVGLRHRFPIRNCLLIGLAFGLAMISKSTSVTFVLLIGFAMVVGIGPKHVREWVGKGLIAGIISGLILAPWFIYMMVMYGDPTALNRVSQLQEWWNHGGGSIWGMLSSKRFFWDRWRETWGAFGWRLIQLDTNSATFLNVILIVTLFCALGLAVYALRFLREQRAIIRDVEAGEASGAVLSHRDETLAIMPWQVTALITMGFACLISYYAILQFGTTFSLTQARYYFPAVIPGAVLIMLGFRSWFPHRWLRFAGAAMFLGLVMMNVIIFTAYVIPYWNQGM